MAVVREAVFITVPNLSARTLAARAMNGINTTNIADDYFTWDFMKDEAGKRYEVMTHAFERELTTDEVRKHFKALGFVGNTAAFITWVTKHEPLGLHASIPDEDRVFRDPVDGRPCVSEFRQDKTHRVLALDLLGKGWNRNWVFVAFREATQQ